MKEIDLKELEALSIKAQQYAGISELIQTNDFFRVHFLHFWDQQIEDAQIAYNNADLKDIVTAAEAKGRLLALVDMKKAIDRIPKEAKNLAQRVSQSRENAERVAIRQRTGSTAPSLRPPM